MIKTLTVTGLVALATTLSAAPAAMAQDPMLGEIKLVPYNFCPRGWTEAEGQMLPIAQNSALFSLLGTTYGGDGRTAFALPDLRGRLPLGDGRGPGLNPTRLGTREGPLQAAGATSGQGVVSTTPTLTLRYCIALVGTYPSPG